MHLTLKPEATRPAAANALQQQARFDDFLALFNEERPHQALEMRVPAELCVRSRPYVGPTPLTYPLHDWTGTVTHCGRICYKSRKVNLSQVFAGQDVGVKQVDDHLWLVTFMDYELGYFDDETCRLEPIENPFGPKGLPMSPEYTVTHVTGTDPRKDGGAARI
jgi:putative transposase